MSKSRKFGVLALKAIGKKLLDVADEVDERGGQWRDHLKEKLTSSGRLAQLKKMADHAVGATSGKETHVDATTSPAQAAPSEPLVFSYGDCRKTAQVFGARSCSWSGRAIRLLETEKIEANYVDLDHPASGPMREELRVETGQLTVPYIYLRGEFIGGFNALDEIYRLGQLDYLVSTEEERRKHPQHGKIEITPRRSRVDALSRPPGA